jgi:flagellar hook-basal body complex protein FliE
MKIDSIFSQLPQSQSVTGSQSTGVTSSLSGSSSAGSSGTSFGETLKDAVKNVSDLQNGADDMANKLATGEPVEIHQAMLAMQKASMALQFTVQVRNKVLDAYQEIMRMQV